MTACGRPVGSSRRRKSDDPVYFKNCFEFHRLCRTGPAASGRIERVFRLEFNVKKQGGLHEKMRSRWVDFRIDLVFGCWSGSRRWVLVNPAADPGHGGGQRREPGDGVRCLHRHRQPGRDDATGPFPDGNRHHGPLRRLPVQCQKLQQRRQRRRQRRLFQPGPDAELRAQRKPGFEAGAGGGVLFRVGARITPTNGQANTMSRTRASRRWRSTRPSVTKSPTGCRSAEASARCRAI